MSIRFRCHYHVGLHGIRVCVVLPMRPITVRKPTSIQDGVGRCKRKPFVFGPIFHRFSDSVLIGGVNLVVQQFDSIDKAEFNGSGLEEELQVPCRLDRCLDDCTRYKVNTDLSTTPSA